MTAQSLIRLVSIVLVVAGLQAAENPAENKLIVNNPDDREDSVPTAWYVFVHQSSADVANTISSQNARIIDIFVEQFTPSYLFTVTYVSNAGPYYKVWWYYYGIDATSLTNNLSTNNARLISLKAYDIGGGQIRFAAIMVQNTGKDSKAWWWYYNQTAGSVASLLSTNNARLIQINSYVTGGNTMYAVVMIGNTGTDQKGFWWYFNTPSSSIPGLVATNNARVTDLDYVPSTGNYNVIMESCAGGCPAANYYFGQPQSQLFPLSLSLGTRIIDTNVYPGCGGSSYSFVTIDNSLVPLDASNEITNRVGQLLRAGSVSGVQGLYLKQVGGAVLANLEESFVYEPASSIKVMAHLYAMTQVQNGAVALNTVVTHYTNGPASCPDPATVSGTETLGTALGEMMRHSDNARTREITDAFFDSIINSYGSSIGMLNSRINHIIGCGGPDSGSVHVGRCGHSL